VAPTMAIFVLTPFIGLAACVVSHVLISRLSPGLQRVRSILASVGVGLAVVLWLGALFFSGDARRGATVAGWEMIPAWALAYVCLVYCYLLGFYVLGETARRIRLLVELLGAGERGMTLEEILSVYNAQMIVDARIERLLAGGQVVIRDGRFVTGNRLMLYAAKTMVLLKLAFLGVRSESEAV